MRFGTWNVRSLKKSGLLTAVAKELARCKLDFVGVEEIRWDKGDTVRSGDYNFFHRKRKRKSSIRSMSFCTPQNSVSS